LEKSSLESPEAAYQRRSVSEYQPTRSRLCSIALKKAAFLGDEQPTYKAHDPPDSGVNTTQQPHPRDKYHSQIYRSNRQVEYSGKRQDNLEET
jgi:hypothetical protein